MVLHAISFDHKLKIKGTFQIDALSINGNEMDGGCWHPTYVPGHLSAAHG